MMLIHNDDQSALSASSSGKEKYLHNEAVFSQWEKSHLNGKYFTLCQSLFQVCTHKEVPWLHRWVKCCWSETTWVIVAQRIASHEMRKKSSMIKTPVKQRTNPSKLKAGADGQQVKNKSRTNLFFLCPYYSLRHVDGKSHAASMAS